MEKSKDMKLSRFRIYLKVEYLIFGLNRGQLPMQGMHAEKFLTFLFFGPTSASKFNESCFPTIHVYDCRG